MIQDPKEISAIVESINKSVQLYSYDDISVEDLSNIISNKLVASGISARIIGYTYNGKDLQSVQYYKQKAWVNFDYSGLDMLFQPIYNRTLDPQNIIKEELVDVQYATPEYPDKSEEEGEVTQDQVNNGVKAWISNYISDFTSMVTTAVNNYLSSHTTDFKGEDGATGPQGPAGAGFASGTYKIPKLIEIKTITAQSSVTFSNLNGDSDIEYYIECDIKMSVGSRHLLLQPNSVSSNGISVVNRAYNNAKDSWIYGYMYLGNNERDGNSRILSKTTLYAKSGQYRATFTECGIFGSDSLNPFTISSRSQWSNTTDNITSLKIIPNNTDTTITGTIKLYKMVDMVVA
ncbi:MAG: hypothetical protein NKF70_00035 [Methanobacterium sp. ERen5]|nr:MAG: hypothetical protein NKF70_00035 [Methanobacterium sp. ERen5]